MAQQLAHDLTRGCSHKQLCSYLAGYGLVKSYRLHEASQPLAHLVTPQWLCEHSGELISSAVGVVTYRGSCHDHNAEFTRINLSPHQLVVTGSRQGLSPEQAYIEVTCPRTAWSLGMKRITHCCVDAMNLWAVTGTNGKSSTIWILHELLQQHRLAHLVISTYGARLYHGGEKTAEPFKPTGHTTPDPDVLYRWLARAYRAGISCVIIEVTSHSIAQQKLCGLRFAGLAFTSFSRDHLDYHPSMAQYFATKWQLFEPPYATAATQRWVSEQVTTTTEFQSHHRAPAAAMLVVNGAADVDVMARNHDLAQHLAAAILDDPQLKASKAQPRYRPPKGRMELVHREPAVIIDYAHTPEALRLVIQELARAYPLVWVVFGCGGDRDQGKRKLMARAASAVSQRIFLTSDNPRHEDPAEIIADVKQGFTDADLTKLTVEPCREAATRLALAEAVEYYNHHGEYPAVLIAGKGHETTQRIGSHILEYSDHAVVKNYFKQAQA